MLHIYVYVALTFWQRVIATNGINEHKWNPLPRLVFENISICSLPSCQAIWHLHNLRELVRGWQSDQRLERSHHRGWIANRTLKVTGQFWAEPNQALEQSKVQAWVLTSFPFVVVWSLSRVWLFATPWTAACQASLSFAVSRSLLRLTSIESVMLSNQLILSFAYNHVILSSKLDESGKLKRARRHKGAHYRRVLWVLWYNKIKYLLRTEYCQCFLCN